MPHILSLSLPTPCLDLHMCSPSVCGVLPPWSTSNKLLYFNSLVASCWTRAHHLSSWDSTKASLTKVQQLASGKGKNYWDSKKISGFQGFQEGRMDEQVLQRLSGGQWGKLSGTVIVDTFVKTHRIYNIEWTLMQYWLIKYISSTRSSNCWVTW